MKLYVYFWTSRTSPCDRIRLFKVNYTDTVHSTRKLIIYRCSVRGKVATRRVCVWCLEASSTRERQAALLIDLLAAIKLLIVRVSALPCPASLTLACVSDEIFPAIICRSSTFFDTRCIDFGVTCVGTVTQFDCKHAATNVCYWELSQLVLYYVRLFRIVIHLQLRNQNQFAWLYNEWK